MAENQLRDVVNQSQLVGDGSPTDVSATTTKSQAIQGEGDVKLGEEDGVRNKTTTNLQQGPSPEVFDTSDNHANGIHALSDASGRITPDVVFDGSTPLEEGAKDEVSLEDGAARSDTDGSRAEGSVAGDSRPLEPSKLIKKFASKPVSFAKYSVPKVVASNGTPKLAVEKVSTPNSSTTSLLQTGRPRLVAKSTSSLQQKAKPYRSAAPDPMQVWNKNRITPQPSTKHLTDEELKQQYGIHMTSRIQEDGDGKEAKWADIDDDDEDDWAPTTIEWNDGTKSTVAPAEVIPTIEEKAKTDAQEADRPKPVQPTKILTSSFSSSIGPNATVLKLGASAERQQAQKSATQQPRGPVEKSPVPSSRTAPAPPPVKSPWAALPPVEKVSPIEINPQQMPPPQRMPSGYGFPPSTGGLTAPSPAKEISADDFSRSWREAPAGQSRELFIPNSGRYEAVPEGRRRMSKTDGNFRATSVLQRPNLGDPHAPAEPSAAFQTSRSSTDHARRRASSTLSGGSGQFGRRLSVTKSGETAPMSLDLSQTRRDSIRPGSQEGPVPPLQTPTYQARGPSPYSPVVGDQPVLDQNAEKQSRKEYFAQIRKRKEEEEARLQAEKEERIRQKLASLGPAPPKRDEEKVEEPITPKPAEEIPPMFVAHSPPKPPLPLATGEPQQYGMMKVHPMDSVKKHGLPASNQAERAGAGLPPPVQSKEQHPDAPQIPSPVVNGIRPSSDSQKPSLPETSALPQPSPRPPKAVSVGSDARAGWADVRNDHRARQAGNLWGLPSNKALGNGTFDQTLAGFTPQDLSTRNGVYPTQGWMNGKSPVERSPQLPFATSQAQENRHQLHHPPAAPDQNSLAANSEVDSLLPISKPAPIGPPQTLTPSQSFQASPNLPFANQGVAAWNNFQQVAGQQERAESEQAQREMATKREEELRTGIRTGPQYSFNETWKQVQLGEQAGQRHVANVAQSTIPASNIFGAVGSVPGNEPVSKTSNGLPARGSRFFPQAADATATQSQNRRSVSYSHPLTPRTPSPPPAEEYASLHPAFDGDFQHPIVHFPREKAVVKLPPPAPARPPTPPMEEPNTPLTWAARVSQPAPQPSLRAVSTPIAQTPSWQARFDGLLRKVSPTRSTAQPARPALAVASSTRELLDVATILQAASVSLPQEDDIDLFEEIAEVWSKAVEDEEDLFEDREAGSLPLIKLPRDAPPYNYSRLHSSRDHSMLRPSAPPLIVSAKGYMTNNWAERPPNPDLFALVRMPGMNKAIKHDLVKDKAPSVSDGGPGGKRNTSGTFGNKHPKHKGPKSRNVSEGHSQSARSRPASGVQSQTQSQGKQSTSSSPMPSSSTTSKAPLTEIIPGTAPSADSQSQSRASAPRTASHGHGHPRGWKSRGPQQRQAQAAH